MRFVIGHRYFSFSFACVLRDEKDINASAAIEDLHVIHVNAAPLCRI